MAARPAGLFRRELHPARIAIERITGRPLSDWPLGPELSYGPPPGPAVATEACTWRGRVMKGEVHDENAWALGGAPGHAGLFAPWPACSAMRRVCWTAAAPRASCSMRSARGVHADRTCGWEKSFDGWHGGDLCSPETIGHTGFTGTGLWIDFDRGLAWTLLTNRVHPTRHRESGIAELRRATGDAVIRAWQSAE
jgi:CubicO group peptidase (beta-lactamase class C family)